MKKYGGLHQGFVGRVAAQAGDEKAAKTRLHQAHGAYISPNSVKKAAAIVGALETGRPDAGDVSRLLSLHASTRERLPFYGALYGHILSRAGPAQTVLDLGCGFNPFSLPLFPAEVSAWHAVDIDERARAALNSYFRKLGMPETAACMDLVAETPAHGADIGLMLKLFPVLEAASPGRAYALADALDVKWLAVSFPTKSLGGKEKGMRGNYARTFGEGLGKLASYETDGALPGKVFGSEIVFALKKRAGPT